MSENNAIILKFEIRSLINLDVKFGSLKKFSLKIKNLKNETVKIIKYSEFSKVEHDFEQYMMDRASEKFDVNSKFQSEILFLKYTNINHEIVKIYTILVINGSFIDIKYLQNAIYLECKISNLDYEMQIIKVYGEKFEHDVRMEEIGLCSEDSEPNQIIDCEI